MVWPCHENREVVSVRILMDLHQVLSGRGVRVAKAAGTRGVPCARSLLSIPWARYALAFCHPLLIQCAPEVPEQSHAGQHSMIKINDTHYLTISDAAARFGVRTKTIGDWIEKGIILQPPTVDHGLRSIRIFPEDYLADAAIRLQAHRRKNKAKKEK